MKFVYLAAPFFTAKQLSGVKMVEKILAGNRTVAGFFSPRNFSNPFKKGSLKWSKKCYQNDIKAIRKANATIAILDFDNSHVDSGTAFEIGYSACLHKPIIALHLHKGITNLMITNSIRAYLTKYQQLQNYNFDELPKINYQGEII